MSDLPTNNAEEVRANRLAATMLALEGGANPLKAAEFGSRVSDALKASRENPENSGAASIISAVFRNATTGELNGAIIGVGHDQRITNSLNSFEAVRDTDAAIDNVEAVNSIRKEDIKNYGFAVTPMMRQP